jgi:hypothetical protein
MQGNLTQWVEAGACRLNYVACFGSGNGLRHRTATGIAEAYEENVDFRLSHQDFNL